MAIIITVGWSEFLCSRFRSFNLGSGSLLGMRVLEIRCAAPSITYFPENMAAESKEEGILRTAIPGLWWEENFLDLPFSFGEVIVRSITSV